MKFIKEWRENGDAVTLLARPKRFGTIYYMNRVVMETFSFFDNGNRPSGKTEPGRFCHGFVWGCWWI